VRTLPFSNLIDIILYNGKAILIDITKKKVIKPITLTRCEIEKQVKEINYTGCGRKRDATLEATCLPPFILAFYSFIFDEMKIPTEEELFSYYTKKFLITNDDDSYILNTFYGNVVLNKDALLGRMLRSYLSLVRDFHFYAVCTESKLFDKVIYSMNQDYFNGVDLLLVYNKKLFNIDMFIDTPNARTYRLKKQFRHIHTNIPKIELKVPILSKKDISLYSDSTLYELFNKIKENA
jgi:hypothetical protein